MLILAISLTIIAMIIDYLNPAVLWIEIAALLVYVPAAHAWVSALQISNAAEIITHPIIRFILWTVCIILTCAIASSTAFRAVPVIRMIITPVSDELLGLGKVRQKDVNQKMIGIAFTAAALTSFSAGGAEKFVSALNAPVISAGAYVHQSITVGWIGYGK